MGWKPKAPKWLKNANISNFNAGLEVITQRATNIRNNESANVVQRTAASIATTAVSVVPSSGGQTARSEISHSAQLAQNRGGIIQPAAGYIASLHPATTTQAKVDTAFALIPVAGKVAGAVAKNVLPLVYKAPGLAGDIGSAAARGLDDFGRAATPTLSRVAPAVEAIAPVVPRLDIAGRGLAPFIAGGAIAGVGTGLGAGLSTLDQTKDAYVRGATAGADDARRQLLPELDAAGTLIGEQDTYITGLTGYVADLEAALAQAGTTGIGAVSGVAETGGDFFEDVFGEASAPFFGEGDTLFERFQSMPPAAKALVVGGGLALALGGAKAFGLAGAAKSTAATSGTPRRSKK